VAKHRVTFLPSGVTVEVDERDFPYGNHGRPGSILDVALRHGVPLPHVCGGNCACTTCHVWVKAGASNLSPLDRDEDDRLDFAIGLSRRSRLGCQAVVRGDVTVEIVG